MPWNSWSGSASCPEMKLRNDKLTFFRQSGWMVLATVAGGFFMMAVHTVVSKPMLAAEYAVFVALLRVFLLMGFPAGGLQVVFAQQAAASVTEPEQRQLSGATRSVLRGTFFLWLVIAALVYLWRQEILVALKITNPAALWTTVILGLAAIWMPVVKGLLQGRQNFGGLGWVMILDGVGRFAAIVIIVQLGGQAAGGMTGALIGHVLSLALGAWLVRHILSGAAARFEWRPWFTRVIPLTFGVGVILFMVNADVIYVQTVYAREDIPFYTPVAMLGLAMVTFTMPMAAVMFPKIVQSAALTEKTNAMQHALAATALLGVLSALVCTVFPELPLRIIYFREPLYWRSAPLVPWIAWCILPLILANVLISNLLARNRFKVVPWLIAIAVAYGAALGALKDKLQLFYPDDFKDAQSLVSRLEKREDAISAFLWSSISEEQQARISDTGIGVEQKQRSLSESINSILRGPSIYDQGLFEGVALSQRTRGMIERKPKSDEQVWFNRRLIEDAYPQELRSGVARDIASFKIVLGTVGAFNSLLLLAGMWFTFRTAEPVSLGIPSKPLQAQ
jgi:O-antigen/teichoic acid export membrane protein